MGRKGQSITLSISETDKKQLEKLALEYGMKWGDRPNISKLIEAIARSQLSIAPNNDWSTSRIEALDIARKTLIDVGKIDEAKEIAQLLRERGELTIPLTIEIDNFLDKPISAWREKIDNFIKRQQPFRLSYQDAAENLLNYTILHAKILPIEKRQYLVVRTEEKEGNNDVEELRHNWTLRLDRIQEAAVVAINKPWQKDLDKIAVEFHLSGGLAFGYKSKPEDIEVSEIEGSPPVRKVVRNVFSTFWFFREIAPYWENCEIVSPENVRDRFKQKVQLMTQKYE